MPTRLYFLFFLLLGLVYIIGLFVPLMDNDSAHHATIAMHMHLTGDYASLVDWNGDYLDKPHFLFWASALSFKLFGINSFAYKFPSFIFTIIGIYSTYRFAKHLYTGETGKLAALMLASAFAFIVAVSDVRMEAILTASIAFSCWHLAVFIDQKKIPSVIFAALGLAVGFSTKGQIGVFVPAIFSFFYILYRKDYSFIINWRWLLLLLFFGLFISPVLYSYYLQYNLHPEKTVRGKDHIDGVTFILLNQSVERFSGGMGHDAKNDYLFFIHSFLWAFAPWSILAFLAVIIRIRNFSSRVEEWGSTGAFVAVLLVVSVSGFKLPHYLNIVFPLAAVMTADLVLKNADRDKWSKRVLILQVIISVSLLFIAAIMNAWAFPVNNILVLSGVIFLLAMAFYFFRLPTFTPIQKAITISVSAMLIFFFLMNINFYPRLLKYQAGQQLATLTSGKVDPTNVYMEKGGSSYSSSYNYYTRSLFKHFDDTLLNKGTSIWILTEPLAFEGWRQKGYKFGRVYSVPHFRVTKLNLKFLNPVTRNKEMSSMMIAELLSKEHDDQQPQ